MLADDDDPRDCAFCRQPFACPLDWREGDDGHWRVALRCGHCGHRRTVVLPEIEVALLRARLAYDAEAIAEEAVLLDAERMAAEVEALTYALRRDLIGASDFAPHRR